MSIPYVFFCVCNTKMLPVTVVKRFLNRQVPTVPLPPDIDEDLTSNAGSWLVVSETRKPPCTASIACQTSSESQLQVVKPRARLRDYIFEESQALPPPKFRPKSRLPQLHYNGLQKPSLHCFTSSLSTPTVVDTPAQSRLLQASAKSLPSPANFHRPIKRRQSTEEQESSEADRARELREIFYCIGFSSKLYCEIHQSAFIDQHIDRIADSLGAGGLLMYLQVWKHWDCWCSCHHILPAEASLSLVLDYLHVSDHRKKKKNSEPSRTTMTTHIKALRWLAFLEIKNSNTLPKIRSYTYSNGCFSSLGETHYFR